MARHLWTFEFPDAVLEVVTSGEELLSAAQITFEAIKRARGRAEIPVIMKRRTLTEAEYQSIKAESDANGDTAGPTADWTGRMAGSAPQPTAPEPPQPTPATEAPPHAPSCRYAKADALLRRIPEAYTDEQQATLAADMKAYLGI